MPENSVLRSNNVSWVCFGPIGLRGSLGVRAACGSKGRERCAISTAWSRHKRRSVRRSAWRRTAPAILPRMPGIFPDQMAPIVRIKDGRRALEMFRWGIPGPKQYGEHPVTNVRNVKSPHWRPWLKPEYRCLVPGLVVQRVTPTLSRRRHRRGSHSMMPGRSLPSPASGAPWTGVCGTKAENPRPRGGRAPAILVPHLRCEWHRWPGPPEGDAGSC